MKDNYRFAIAFSLLILFSSVSFCATREDIETQLDELQKQVDEISAKTSMGNQGIQTARAAPEVDGKKWFITFEVLNFHPKVGGTAFAYTNQTPLITLPIKGTTESLDFNWHWGFRIGVGKQFEKKEWDVYLNYFHYDAGDSSHAQGNSTNAIIPLRGAIVTNGGVLLAKSQYEIDIHEVDLELGRNYFISDDVAFRPYIGLKSAWVNLEQIIRYTGSSLDVNTVHIRDTSDYWGMGILFGVGSQWFICNGFRIYSSLSTAFLYGIFDVDHKEKHSIQTDDKISLRDNHHRFSPFARGAIGVGWGKYLEDKKRHVEVNLGYEVQYFLRINQMLRFYEYNAFRFDNYSEDLSLQGIVLRARLDF